jgi:hypothetical protein
VRNYSRAELCDMVQNGEAIDISNVSTLMEALEISCEEGILEKIGVCIVDGKVEGYLFKGFNTKTLYAITHNSQAVYFF